MVLSKVKFVLAGSVHTAELQFKQSVLETFALGNPELMFTLQRLFPGDWRRHEALSL